MIEFLAFLLPAAYRSVDVEIHHAPRATLRNKLRGSFNRFLHPLEHELRAAGIPILSKSRVRLHQKKLCRLYGEHLSSWIHDIISSNGTILEKRGFGGLDEIERGGEIPQRLIARMRHVQDLHPDVIFEKAWLKRDPIIFACIRRGFGFTKRFAIGAYNTGVPELDNA